MCFCKYSVNCSTAAPLFQVLSVAAVDSLAHSGGDIDSLVLDGKSSLSPALYGCGVSVEASRGSQALVMRAGGSARVPVWAPMLPPHLLLHVSTWLQTFFGFFYRRLHTRPQRAWTISASGKPASFQDPQDSGVQVPTGSNAGTGLSF